MLLSFNKCSIAALTAPIYQLVEETLYEKTQNFKSSLLLCVSPIIYRFVCIQYHVIVSSDKPHTVYIRKGQSTVSKFSFVSIYFRYFFFWYIFKS